MQIPLITGFPGFIATQIIGELFRQKKAEKVFAVILPSQINVAAKTIIELKKDFAGIDIHLIEGDITLPDLGMTEEEIHTIREQVNMVWHLAAIYDLAVPKEAAWKVNVVGTQMVNDFVQTIPRIERYMYFSTAYVAGTREGLLKENELIRPESFKNYYEETKYEAELLVERLKKVIPITIIRPGIVRGHSLTGATIKFDGPYFFINMIDTLRKLPVIPYIGRSTSFINVVPIDFIIQSAVYCSESDMASGITLHLTDPDPHPVEEVYRHMVKQVSGKFPKGRIPLSAAKLGLKLKLVRKALRVEKETLDYLTWNAEFDTSAADQILKDSGIKCADFIKTLPCMVAFYELHKKDEQFHIDII